VPARQRRTGPAAGLGAIFDSAYASLRATRTPFAAAVPDPDQSPGFPPDFRVYPGVHDILAGRDVQMEFAVPLLSQDD
jgi:hypothetical protein